MYMTTLEYLFEWVVNTEILSKQTFPEQIMEEVVGIINMLTLIESVIISFIPTLVHRKGMLLVASHRMIQLIRIGSRFRTALLKPGFPNTLRSV